MAHPGTARTAARDFARTLRMLPALSGVGEDTFERLGALAVERHYAAGQLVFRKGDPSDFLLIVLEGRVAISSLAADGSEVMLNLIGPGEVVGEVGVIDGGPRSADATAGQETRAILFARRDFLPVLRSEPRVAEALLLVLCTRLRQTTSFVEDAVLEPLPRRLLHRIQALAGSYGRSEPGRGGVRIEHGLSQQQLGDSIGASRVSVSKLLNAWRAERVLEFGRGYLVIRDMGRLEARVEAGAISIST